MMVITNVLFLIANSLLMPVILLLIGLFVHALLSLGGFYGHYLRRLKEQKRIEELFAAIEKRGDAGSDWARLPADSFFGHYADRLREAGDRPHLAERILDDAQDEAEVALARHRLPMRLGPMLGLMATLIPLGPALSALGSGEIAEMALNLQIAFSTTVVGVLVGGVGLFVHTNKRRWLHRDLAHLGHIARIHAAPVDVRETATAPSPPR